MAARVFVFKVNLKHSIGNLTVVFVPSAVATPTGSLPL